MIHATYHPVRALAFELRLLHFIETRLRLFKVLLLDVLGNLYHLLHGIGLKKILVVEMVEQDVDALFHVVDLGLEILRCHSLDTRDGRCEQIDNWLCASGNV